VVRNGMPSWLSEAQSTQAADFKWLQTRNASGGIADWQAVMHGTPQIACLEGRVES